MYLKIPYVHLSKLDRQRKAIVYLWKEPWTKEFRPYDPNTGSLRVSRDMTFDEMKAQEWKPQDEETNTSHSTFIVAGSSVAEEEESNTEETDISIPTQSRGRFTEQRVENATEQSAEYTTDSELRKYRLLSEMYDDTEPIDLNEEVKLLNVEGKL